MICIICNLHKAQKNKMICEQCEDEIYESYDKVDDQYAIESREIKGRLQE